MIFHHAPKDWFDWFFYASIGSNGSNGSNDWYGCPVLHITKASFFGGREAQPTYDLCGRGADVKEVLKISWSGWPPDSQIGL
jgi:hypothetical protein